MASIARYLDALTAKALNVVVVAPSAPTVASLAPDSVGAPPRPPKVDDHTGEARETLDRLAGLVLETGKSQQEAEAEQLKAQRGDLSRVHRALASFLLARAKGKEIVSPLGFVWALVRSPESRFEEFSDLAWRVVDEWVVKHRAEREAREKKASEASKPRPKVETEEERDERLWREIQAREHAQGGAR